MMTLLSIKRNLLSDSHINPTRATLFFVLSILLLIGSTPNLSAIENFPVHPSIQANVDFWDDIYSRYNTTQGILHDKDDLTIIYGVISLVKWDMTGAGQINRQLIKLAKNHYKDILLSLDKGIIATTDDEKHVAELFNKTKAITFKKAYRNIRLQIGQKDRFLQGVIRSGAYLPFIENIFKAYNLPLELAYLPHVESSFNPEAHSKAGAAGLWQFTRSTGKQFLTINHVLDERYDPIRSTHAAALFLKNNYNKLQEWPMAITAYNYGPAGMLRAAKLHGSYQNILKNHSSRIFKFASRNFYPEFIAAVQVARRLEKDPLLIKNRPEAILSIRLANYISLSDLSSYFKISPTDIIRLNPSFRSSIIKDKKYIPKNIFVKIPATEFTRRLADSIPSQLFHSSQLRDTIHIVRRGDTATSVSSTYNIRLKELIRANALDQYATIRIGQQLRLPQNIKSSSSTKRTVISNNSKWRPNIQ
ncbi:MAG: transglycosylase SLT domain-containing protein [Desulfobulbaceae bacterium]|nr:transglycosylase SLT domain-containing protein [Desulfobulbaceae bacterium]